MAHLHSYGGHEIINPFGAVVRVSQRTIRALDMRGYLHRDSASGLKGMDPEQYGIFADAERGTEHYYELGEDCSGPNAVVCRCPVCQRLESDIDHTRLPGRSKVDELEAERVVREVKAKRKHRKC